MLQSYPHLLWLSLYCLKPVAAKHINNYWRMVGLDWVDSLLFFSEIFSGLVWKHHMLLNIVPFLKTSNESWLPALDWLRCQGYKSLVGQLPSPQKMVGKTYRVPWSDMHISCVSDGCCCAIYFCLVAFSHSRDFSRHSYCQQTAQPRGGPWQHRAILSKKAQGRSSSAPE